MTDSQPERSPRGRLLAALDVGYNAKVGAVVGVLVAVAVYGFFVVVPGKPLGQAARYVVLAFIMFVSTAILVTAWLTARTVAGMVAAFPKWIRRGGTASLLAGLLWTALAVGAPVVGSELRSVYGQLLVVAALALVFGVWAINATYRDQYGRIGSLGAALAAVGLLLVARLATVAPGGYATGLTDQADPAVFFGVNLVALVGMALVGVEAMRTEATPPVPALGLALALPLVLVGLPVAAGTGTPGLLPLALGVPFGVAWTLVGYYLGKGRGVPPAEAFGPDPETDLDPE